MSHDSHRHQFISKLLPWILGGVMSLVYLLTMGHGLSAANLGLVTQLAGYDWPQNNLPPTLLIVTLPWRLLDISITPLTVNFLSALAGGLTLVLLARCVALLPFDRTQSQRDRERSDYSQLTIKAAWLPPLLAVLACGLQLTFWESSVDGSGRILEALLFIYPVRCLLEHRIDGGEKWLTKAAFVFGLGMANNWLMVALLPIFLVATFWIVGLRLFNPAPFLRMTVAGLLGCLFCLALPIGQSIGAGAPLQFGDACHAYFSVQKNLLMALPLRTVWILGLTSLLPVTVMAIRWAASFGDNSPMGVALAGFTMHLVHGIMFLACLWSVFDSPLSPRGFMRQPTDIAPYFASQSWLPLYLLTSLAIGYLSGYFLLVFKSVGKAARYEADSSHILNSIANAAIWGSLLLVVFGLIGKNLSYIRSQGSKDFARLGQELVESIPNHKSAAGGVVVLSDDRRLLLLAEATIQMRKPTQRYVFLNTASMPYPAYHHFLNRRNPAGWEHLSNNTETNFYHPNQLVASLQDISKAHDIYYLQPSFGYYFEPFHAEPDGLISRLQPYTDNELFAPPMGEELVARNNSYWKSLDPTVLEAVVKRLPPPTTAPKSAFEKVLQKLQIKPEHDSQAILVGACYSRALNAWGKHLQARHDLETAGWSFQRALILNPLNVAAKVNLLCNETLRNGGYKPFEISTEITDLISQYASADQMLAMTGPFDEPRFCYPRAVLYMQNAKYRQAASEFQRVKDLAPEDVGAYAWLSHMHNLLNQPDTALAIIREARSKNSAKTNFSAELTANEATAHFIKRDTVSAVRTLEAAMQQNPHNERLENAAVQLFMNFQSTTNALTVINRQLKRKPDDVAALNNQAAALIRLGEFEKALPALNRVIADQPTNHVAILNRAIAQLQSDHLLEARKDYEMLAHAYPTSYQIYYGLGEIAYRRKDTSEAIKNYEMYFAYAPTNTEEARSLAERLKELKASPH